MLYNLFFCPTIPLFFLHLHRPCVPDVLSGCQSGKPARKSLGKEAAAAPAAPKARSKTPAKTATLEPPAPSSPHKAAVVAEAVTAATPGHLQIEFCSFSS